MKNSTVLVNLFTEWVLHMIQKIRSKHLFNKYTFLINKFCSNLINKTLKNEKKKTGVTYKL